MTVTIHPAMFQHPEWAAIVDRLEQRTGLRTQFTTTRYATLQPVAETLRNTTATQEQQA